MAIKEPPPPHYLPLQPHSGPVCRFPLAKLGNLDDSSHECIAKARHERELEEINSLVKPSSETEGSYKITARGPAKIITRIKGFRPGLKVVPGATPGSVTIRTQGSARTTTRVKNAFSNLKQDKTFPQDLTLEQSSIPKTEPSVQTPLRTPPGSLLHRSPKGRSPDLSSQGPKSRLIEKTPVGTPQSQRIGQSPKRRSLDQTPQSQTLEQSSRMQSPEKPPLATPLGAPLDTSRGTPRETPRGTSAETPVGTPVGTPLDISRGAPLETTRGTPGGTPRGTPGGTPRGTPVGTPVGTSLGTSRGAPLETTGESLLGAPLETSRGTPRETPGGTPRGTPRRTPRGTPRGTPAGTPVGTPVGTPLDISRGAPLETTRGTPGGTLRGTPAGTPVGTSLGTSRGAQQETTQWTPQGTPQVEFTGTPLETTTESLQSQQSQQHADLFQDMSYESETLGLPYETQLEDSVFERESPSEEFTPLYSSLVMEGGPTSPKVNFDVTASEDLMIQLEARETLCNELQNTLANLTTEKNDLMKKFETTLQELETLKKLNAASPVIPTSCKEEIEALELEIKVMRSGNLSPEQEAEVIRKEVDVLKKYCMKLKSVENENEKLKLERDTLKSQVILSDDPGNEKRKSVKDNLNRQVAGILGDTEEKHKVKVDSLKDVTETLNNTDTSKVDNLYLNENQAYIDELNSKLKNMEELVRERDMLANKVQRLEKELLQYRDLPEDIDVYRNRSKMLDSALEERDKMSKKVEQLKEMEDELNQLKKKSSRVDQLEEELKLYSKNDKNIGSELKKATSRCTCLEKELENVKMERDSMRTRIEYMKKEIDILRAKSKESEVFRVERDKLQLRVNELTLIQVQYENLLLKCKCLEHAAAEKEMYKYKYEEVLSKECQGDMLRSQVEAAKGLERERNALVKQVGDLESCICDQEEEIKKLMSQIDNLSRNKDDCQCRMREALANMRAEIEKKDCLIAESEEKLAAVQAQLKSSIQGVSCETTCYKTRIEDLERELSKAQSQIETLKKQLNKNDSSLKGVEKLTRSECESVATMKRELDAAKEENKKLRDIANKMVTLTGDEHVQNMLKQSQCAVKRVVEELGRQYKEWDNMKRNQKKGIFAQVNKRCPCKYKHVDPHHQSDSENEKLIEELEDIQREKDKLEQIVKQIQNDKSCEGPQNELKSLRADNAKLQELLKKEVEKRKSLEKKLKTA